MIDSNFVKSYCLDRFKDNYRISGDETELIIPSIFISNDYKRHMSINLENGLWRCFKSGNVGNFIKLYSILEGISYRKAYEKFIFDSFINEREEAVKKDIKIEPSIDEDLIKNFYELDCRLTYDDSKAGILLNIAKEVIRERKLENFKFYICSEGFYEGRLIIPYMDERKRIFFFQGRSLIDREPKYLNCKTLKSSWVLLPFDYASTSPLYITEGAFDALSLKETGLNATTTVSCNVSHQQMKQLSFYGGSLVVAYDRDEAGLHGLKSFLRLSRIHKIRDCFFSFPPSGYKDWNQLLAEEGKDAVLEALTNKQELNDITINFIEL